jgi:hypothetical protein
MLLLMLLLLLLLLLLLPSQLPSHLSRRHRRHLRILSRLLPLPLPTSATANTRGTIPAHMRICAHAYMRTCVGLRQGKHGTAHLQGQPSKKKSFVECK